MPGFNHYYALYKYVLNSQPQKNKECLISFIYFDNDCGVTANLEGNCIVEDDKLKLTKNYLKDEKKVLKIRLSDNSGDDFYILDTDQIIELGLPIRPDWLDSYSKPFEEYLRTIAFLHPFRFPNFPDDIQAILPPNEEKHSEVVWVRLFNLRKDNTFKGILLNQPNQNFHINEGDHVTILPLFDENTKEFFFVCKDTIGGSSEFAEWMKYKLNAIEAYQTSLMKYETLLSENKNNAKIWFEKGDFLVSYKQFELANSSYNQGLQSDPNNESAWFGKSIALLVLGHFNQALDACETVLKINPKNVPAWGNKAAILNGLGRFEEAHSIIDHVVTLEPDNINYLMNKGFGLLNLERYYDAIEIFDRIISIAPDSALAWSKKGKAYLFLNQFDESISCFDKALSLDPEILDARENRDRALSQKNKL